MKKEIAKAIKDSIFFNIIQSGCSVENITENIIKNKQVAREVVPSLVQLYRTYKHKFNGITLEDLVRDTLESRYRDGLWERWTWCCVIMIIILISALVVQYNTMS